SAAAIAAPALPPPTIRMRGAQLTASRIGNCGSLKASCMSCCGRAAVTAASQIARASLRRFLVADDIARCNDDNEATGRSSNGCIASRWQRCRRSFIIARTHPGWLVNSLSRPPCPTFADFDCWISFFCWRCWRSPAWPGVGTWTVMPTAGRGVGPFQGQGRWGELPTLVENLKKDRAFRCRAPLAAGEEETAHAAPGYPVLLAALQTLPVEVSERTVRWIQCVLGTLTAGFYFLFARRAFRHRVIGALAGFLCAVHPFWIVNTAEINDGALATFLLAACIALGARGSQSGGALTSLLYGLGLASLALVRAAALPFAFVALLWFLLRCRFVSRGWLCAVLAVLGFVNGLAPWSLRNYQVFGEWIPIVD